MNKPIVFSVIVIIIVAVAGAIWYYRYGQSLEDNGIAPNEDIIVKNGGEEPVGKENQPIAGNEADGNGTGSEIKNPKAPAPTPGPGADGEPMLVNTPEGAIEAAKVKEDNPAPVAQTYSYITTCNQACTAIGYEAGYCGDWVENKDNTISQCANKQEFAFFQDYYDGMKLKDCQFTGDINAVKKTICCCKGEPQNPSGCPAIQWPEKPMDCIEQPGYLKNTKTGACCWYRATCYGPEGSEWVKYNTKAECLAK